MALLQFEHVETETAEDTISRYQVVILKCRQQDVEMKYDLLERMFLSQPNGRYMFLRNNYLHSAVKNLNKMYASLKDVNTEYQNRNKTPPAETAAFMEALRVEAEKQTAVAAELNWIQRGKDF